MAGAPGLAAGEVSAELAAIAVVVLLALIVVLLLVIGFSARARLRTGRPRDRRAHGRDGGGSNGRRPGTDARHESPGARDDGLDGRDDGPGARDDGLDARDDGPDARNGGLAGPDEGPGARDGGLDARRDGPAARDGGVGARREGREVRPAAGEGTAGAGQDGPAPRPPRAGDIVIVCRDDLVPTYVSPATLPLLGYRGEALTGSSLAPLVHPDDVDRLTAFVRAPAGPPGIQVRLRHAEGDWVWLIAAPGTGPYGQPGLTQFYARDVSERIRAEGWLAGQRRLTDVVLAVAGDAFIATDDAGAIVEWNRAAEAALGWSRDDVIGRDVIELIVPPELRDEYRTGMAQLWHRNGERLDEPTEAVLIRRDGSRLPVEVTTWPVEVGQTRRLNTLIRDTTERKQVEQTLREAREQALEASRLKSEFLATMSHEIRTPMNGVIGLAGLMLETDLNQTQRRYAEGIRTAGDALLSTINDILDFSKVEAGKIVIDEVDFNLRDLIEEVVEIVAQAARGKGLELVGYCSPELPVALRGDPGRLRQVLLNLTSNAVKFTERGEVVLGARQVESTEDGRPVLVRIEVTDTGIGIAPAQRDRIFEAFSQADASTTRRFGGTGLGLAICRRLVEAMGGRIGVESEVGLGSQFWCEIPLERQAGDSVPGPGRQHDLSGLRVLVVDNNETNRLILEGQMRAWRMAPTAVESGEVALETLRAANRQGRAYDLAVLDMVMPGMDGIELARRIGADPDIPTVHLVLLTSGTPVDRAQARAAGISASLTKPVHQSELFDALARMLSPQSDDEPTEPEPTPEPAGAPTARGRVLLAEDNAINQQVATAILERLGYQVDVAGTGRAALDLTQRQRYDVVLMDCQMPEMDGYAATEELRRREQGRGRHVPVIALTASALAEDRERCLAAGMDDYLSKPIAPDQLATILERWSPRSSTVDESGSTMDVRVGIEHRLAEIRDFSPASAGALLRQLVGSFLDRTPGYVTGIADAVRAGDGASAAAQAHSLQGMAGNLGAGELAATCAEMSRVCRAGHLDEAAVVVPRLEAQKETVVAALRQLQPEL